MTDDLGETYTRGRTFRARAEARQREYRARVLKAGWAKWGHFLDQESADRGRNFIRDEIHEAARKRSRGGKGVTARTFENMLSSQALCFNVFAPLADDLDLAARVLGPLLGIATVRQVSVEHTPSNDLFHDQSTLGGVDCDVLIDAVAHDGARTLLTIEMKLVEADFSKCAFRDRKRIMRGRPYCVDEVEVAGDEQRCLYAAKGYAYWQRSRELGTLARAKLPVIGCPFEGAEWQLWVNHSLAHAEAARRGARRAMFTVCAPETNETLLRNHILERFQARLANPDTFCFLPLDKLLARIRDACEEQRAEIRDWAQALTARYGNL